MKVILCDPCYKNKIHSSKTREISFQHTDKSLDLCESCMYGLIQAYVYDMRKDQQKAFFNNVMG